MDYSKEILHEISFHTDESLELLTESVMDTLKSIKDKSVESIKSFVDSKYDVIEKKHKDALKILKRNGFDMNEFDSIVKNTLKSYQGKMKQLSKQGNVDKKDILKVSVEIKDTLNENLTKKGSNWFNLKYWDPASLGAPLVLAMIVSVIKYATIIFIFAWAPVGAATIVFSFLFKFILVLFGIPIMERMAQMLAIQNGMGAKYITIQTMMDTILMPFMLLFQKGYGLMAYIVIKVLSTIGVVSRQMMLTKGAESDDPLPSYNKAMWIQLLFWSLEVIVIGIFMGLGNFTPTETPLSDPPGLYIAH